MSVGTSVSDQVRDLENQLADAREENKSLRNPGRAVTFIGGPSDGTRMALPENLLRHLGTFRVAEATPVLMRAFASESNVGLEGAMPIRQVEYRIHRLLPYGFGNVTWVAVYERTF